MDAIRRASIPTAPARNVVGPYEAVASGPDAELAQPASPFRRFAASIEMDFDKWHDGIGYDLEALREMSPEERAAVETTLVHSVPRGWRQIEALAALGTPRAIKALRDALDDRDPEVRMAVMRSMPELVSDAQRTATLLEALESARFFGGLSQALDEVAEFHPQEIVAALFRGALEREGDVAVHFAAMLMYIHGKAEEPFDMRMRPFFLQFNTAMRADREAAFRELCARIGVNPEGH